MRQTTMASQGSLRRVFYPLVSILGCAMILFVALRSQAATVEEVTKAMPLITQTANQLCASVSNAGTTETAQVQAEAGLRGLLRNLANIGVSAKVSGTQYQGVLQSDLAKAISDQNQCRSDVFHTICATLFPNTPVGTVQTSYVGYQPTGDFVQEFRYFIEITGARQNMKIMVDGVMDAMEEQLKKDFPGDVQAIAAMSQIVRAEMPKLDAIVDRLLPFYRKYYTVSQIQELNRLYSTPLMREMIRNSLILTGEATPVIMQMMQEFQDRASQRIKEWDNFHKRNR